MADATNTQSQTETPGATTEQTAGAQGAQTQTAQTEQSATTADPAAAIKAELEAAQRKLREYETAAEAERQAKLTEAEKLKERAEKAEREAQAARVQAVALRLGAEPDLVAPHLTNVKAGDEEAAIKALLDKFPQLKSQKNGVTVGVNAGRSPEQAGIFTQSQIGDREFFNRNREAILKAMREGKIVKG
jgi:membrane protein involved in colicin uptake